MMSQEDLRSKLSSLYIKLESEIKQLPAKCYGCGKCCNFKNNGMKLYALSMEKELITLETGVFPYLVEQGHCNFQVNGLCSIHQIRPLGCRTFFSEAPNSEEHQNLFEKYHVLLKNIAKEENLEYQFEPFFEE